ncbi:protein farnesyltransferase subunit beta-like [Chanos chanos]|uniref:Protein farnesyltransferase subunit beta n=1 Tax=Chanos chanos TaxID=29144 RepID=A0A6J2WFS7_CHACN|nr:protein farnesyltransferase subunit beta-like [Chanos chanos]
MEAVNTSLRCFNKAHVSELFEDDNLETVTSKEQKKLESTVQEMFCSKFQDQVLPRPVLLREQHSLFLMKAIHHLPDSSESLDVSRCWLCHWVLHSLNLLEQPLPASTVSDVCQFLARCQSPTGGFGGGPGQQAHLAATYAAVNALCTIGTEEAYNVIDREKLLHFLCSLKQPDGSFALHEGGEIDVRGVYCAASVASLTNIITATLFEDSINWVVRCQTWEGGLAGIPGLEAHGGYTFCGLGALVILKHEYLLDLKAMLRWAVCRQMRFEGGFQGRCNKLVDGCYSFWMSSVLAMLHHALIKQGDAELSRPNWVFDTRALQEYLLFCCQSPDGGLLDKPGKPKDFYHTCYCLSGLSIAQHFKGLDTQETVVLGDDGNKLAQNHPVYNVCPERVARALDYFGKLPIPEQRENGPTFHI